MDHFEENHQTRLRTTGSSLPTKQLVVNKIYWTLVCQSSKERLARFRDVVDLLNYESKTLISKLTYHRCGPKCP